MKWKTPPSGIEYLGEVDNYHRYRRKRFAWFPVRLCNGETIWWEHYMYTWAVRSNWAGVSTHRIAAEPCEETK